MKTTIPNPRPPVNGDLIQTEAIGAVALPLSFWERLSNQEWFRKIVVLVCLFLVWELYALHIDNELMFPTFHATISTWYSLMASGVLLTKTWYSLQTLFSGYALGFAVAVPLTIAATLTRPGRDLLDVLTSSFYPLPAVAMLPLALLWFGLGEWSLRFVIANSVVWAIALNMHTGFKSVPMALRMVGANYGLRGLRYAALVLFPAATGTIITGLKTGWYFAWRTLIAAELYMGVSSGAGGLGWHIAESKNNLAIPEVFAGLLMIMCLGLLVENFMFKPIENATIRKWGMVH